MEVAFVSSLFLMKRFTQSEPAIVFDLFVPYLQKPPPTDWKGERCTRMKGGSQ